MMEPAIQIIVDNADEHPEFRYYIKLMKKAERNLESQPDICIEICKALIEGVSKTIILDANPEVDKKKLNSMDVSPLAKWACQLLKQDNNVIEDEFARRVASVAEFLGVLRNERGDVCHGRSVPKPVQSNNKLAAVIFQISSGLLTYMLDGFFSTKSNMREAIAELAVAVDLEKSEMLELAEVDYEANQEFNSWLDDQYPYDGKLNYSFALYSLYYEDYLIRLTTFDESLESEEL